MAKIGLVLEGGGMRGAYTAGVMSWLIENNFEFDVTLGISSGALYGVMFALGIDKETFYNVSTKEAAHWRNSGLGAILFERQIIGYDYMFDTIFSKVGIPVNDIDKIKGEYFAGVYDMDAQDTVWKSKHELPPYGREYIKAACTLPVMGRSVKIEGKTYMDGGITTMIPLEESINQGCEYHVVVSTKSPDFVRKPQKSLTYKVMRIIYRKFPKLIESFEGRTQRYYEEVKMVDQLVQDHKAVKINPSVEMGVGRFGGNIEQYDALFKLAYEDCESKRNDLESLFKASKQ